MPAKHLSKNDFKKEVLENKGIVFVDFYAQWCGPCKMTSPIIDQLADEMKEVSFFKVNVDDNQDLASQYAVFSIPTFIIFKNGQPINQFVGAKDKQGFKDEIDKVENT